MNWLVLGDGFGWKHGMYGIEWIYSVPGRETQEGQINWSKVGINYRLANGSSRTEAAMHEEVREKALPLMKAEVQRRTTPTECEVLRDKIYEALGSNLQKAHLLGTTYLDRDPANLVAHFRHQITRYDADLKQGEDRLLVTLRSHNCLLEILTVYRTFKAEILAIESPASWFDWHIALASLDHTAIYRAAVSEVEARR